ncbi:TauD/TfdA family dioxygenase [Actinomadura luteofluorescens]|uniref:TauD/TfdA family dioxygenase n=1 Tax=Actinomadura luteofluorescens TaxID=46163 RepID=UPI0030CDA10A
MDVTVNDRAIAELGLSVGESGPPIARADGTSSMEDARAWLTERRGAFRAALARYGCLLVRGLPIASVHDFAGARDVLLDQRVSYREKATPRSDYGEGVLSSTDLPSAQVIRLHNENSYTLDFPGVLLFGCLVAPEEGGATTVADTREVLARIPAELADRCRRLGWVLARNYREHVSLPWPTAFGTSDRAAVEDYCRRSSIGIRWLPDDGLATTQRRATTIHHPVTGEEVWFNHIAFWSRHSLDPDVRDVLLSSYGPDGLPFDTFYGDGSPIDAEDVAALNAAYDGARRRESWRAGDLLLVDNILSCHGREAFRGDRKILVAMGEQVSLADCRPTAEPAPEPVAG